MLELVIFSVCVLAFNAIALAIALAVTRRWREYRLPACIQRHIPVYDPLRHQPKATVRGIAQYVLADAVPEYIGTLVASLSFGDLIIGVLGLQTDQMG